MVFWKKMIVAASVLVLAGCATSSGVLQLGPDTYTISTAADMFRGGGAGARQEALTAAQKHCVSMGKELMTTNINVGGFVGGGNTISVNFRCLAKGDPELQRPDFQRAPDVVIQDQRGR